jgi:hypothetical protein
LLRFVAPLVLVACADAPPSGITLKLRDPADVAVEVKTPNGPVTILPQHGEPEERPIPVSTPPRAEGLLFPMSAIRNPDHSVTFRCDSCISHPSRLIVPVVAIWQKDAISRESIDYDASWLRVHVNYNYIVPGTRHGETRSAFEADLVTPTTNILELRYQPPDHRGDAGIFFELGVLLGLCGVPMLIAGAKGEHGWYAPGIPLSVLSALSIGVFFYGIGLDPPAEEVLWPPK